MKFILDKLTLVEYNIINIVRLMTLNRSGNVRVNEIDENVPTTSLQSTQKHVCVRVGCTHTIRGAQILSILFVTFNNPIIEFSVLNLFVSVLGSFLLRTRCAENGGDFKQDQ